MNWDKSFRIVIQQRRTVDTSDARNYGLNVPLGTICLAHGFTQTLGFVVIARTQSITVNISTILLIQAFNVTAILAVNLNGRSKWQSSAAVGERTQSRFWSPSTFALNSALLDPDEY